MHHTLNQTRQGIAVISVLLILAAILLVGLSSMFLTQMNLGIAGNVQTNTIAQANADAGLDAALAELEKYYQEEEEATGTGRYPTSLSIPSVNGQNFSPTYELASYELYTDDRAMVRVIGTGPRNAEHLSEALAMMQPGGPRFPPAFDFGLATEGVIETSGTSIYTDAGLHGNAGFKLHHNDDFRICIERDADGTCTDWEEVDLSDAPVSGSPGATTCSPEELCEDGEPKILIDPITVDPNYNERRDSALADAASGEEWSETFGIECDVVFSSPPADDYWDDVPPESTVCVESGFPMTLPRDTELTDVNIVSQGDIIVGRDSTLTTSTLISMEGRIQADSNEAVTIESSRVFSQEGITFNGQHTRISGKTTLASAGDITIRGGAPATTNEDGDPSVGLALIAEGDIEVNGSSDWYVAVIGGGTFTQNGTSTVYGRVTSVGDMEFNGGIDIDSGLDIFNHDVKEEGPPQITTVSRR